MKDKLLVEIVATGGPMGPHGINEVACTMTMPIELWQTIHMYQSADLVLGFLKTGSPEFDSVKQIHDRCYQDLLLTYTSSLFYESTWAVKESVMATAMSLGQRGDEKHGGNKSH